MDKGRYAKAPLLYIHQPTEQKINATMQHHYRSSRRKQEKKREEDGTTIIYEHEEEEPESGGRGTDKRFKEMTIEEQLMYLTDRTEYLPRLICSIRTKERIYKGIILSYQDGKATVRSGRRKVEISKEDIEYIRLVSL